MSKIPALLLACAAGLAACAPMEDDMSTSAATGASAEASYPMVGGAAMYPSRTIVQNAVNSKDHTTLVAAVQAAGLAETLSGAGPFTVFAPTNAAFERLPAGTVDSLLQPANKAQLTKVLTYHVVPGRKTRADIAADIQAGGGTATYTTVAGSTIRVGMDGGNLVVWDANNGKSTIAQADVMQSNGVIHVVDAVLLPTMG